MELVHTSDIHLGAFSGKRLESAALEAFEEIASYAVENKYKYLVVAGDLLERPRLENYSMLIGLVKTLKRLRDSGVRVVATPGSHDRSVSGADTIAVLHEAGLVSVPRHEISEKLTLHPLLLGDVAFYALPGLRNSAELEYLRENRLVFKDLESIRERAVLVAHTPIEFAGYKLEDFASRYGRVVVSGEEALRGVPSRVSYVALGHIHFPMPLFDEAEANLAYPGAPIGRDLADLHETVLLSERYGRKRRFLAVDLSYDRPRVRSVWSDFGVLVEERQASYSKLEEFVREVNSALRDLSCDYKYRVLILRLEGVRGEEVHRLLSEVRAIERSRGVSIYLSARAVEAFEGVALDLDYSDSIEEMEREALREVVERLGLKVSVDKLASLIESLSVSAPEDVKKQEFYEQLFERLEGLLREVVGVSRPK